MSELNNLIEAFENLLGYIDSPIIRRRISDHQTQDIVASARKALTEYKEKTESNVIKQEVCSLDLGKCKYCNSEVEWMSFRHLNEMVGLPICVSCGKCQVTGKE